MTRTKQVRKNTSMFTQHASKKTSIQVPAKSFDASSTSDYESFPCDDIEVFLNAEYQSYEEFENQFLKYMNMSEEDPESWFRQGYKRACEEVERRMNELLESLPKAECNSFLHYREQENITEDQNKDPNLEATIVRSSKRKSLIDLPITEFKRPKTPKRDVPRKRSASASSATSSRAAIALSSNTLSSSRSAETVKTPIINCLRRMDTTPITPKLYNDTPLSVMRRPQHGEMALSMQGSPLMVGSVLSEDVPTVTVPLPDGRIFSIIPEPGAPPPDLPDFDDDTKRYLQTLRAHLQILAPSSP